MVGVFGFGPSATGPEAFREELAARGWKEGAQITVEVVNASGDYDRLTALARALAGKSPAVIVASNPRVVEAVVKAAPRTPIVMVGVGDPVAYGFAKSLARPGGMVTGVSNLAPDMGSKFVELLISAAPGVRRIGFLIDAESAAAKRHRDTIQRSSRHYSVEATIAEVKRREDIEPALQNLAKGGVQALAVMPGPLLTFNRKEILQFASVQRWPVVAGPPQWVRDGALLSYGVDGRTEYKRAAYYVDRILRGAKPADLPIELPMTFETTVNLNTANSLGFTLPPEIMVRATQVVE